MPKLLSFRQGLLSVLFWSIIAAAFIGPGTVTTASKSGASFHLDLLWALVFSLFATILLQEAAARITIASGKSLGEIIAVKYGGQQGQRLKWMLFLAVAFGCGAYQTGNMLGALSGLAIFSEIPQQLATIILALVSASFLWIGNFRIIANLLGLVVFLMGIAFLYVAFQTDVSAVNLAKSAVIPRFPDNSTLLIIGLIGTTIVPYNLFLASGLSKGQNIQEMRIGVISAVVVGGIISIAIMVTGTQISGEFSFTALAAAMAEKLGAWASVFFGFGLFAAGMSSSITAPLAAAVTAQSLFGAEGQDWTPRSRNFRLVWVIILGIGLLFGLLEVKPVPAIILAQAINGVLLPVVAIFLILMVNDRELIPEQYRNSLLINLVMLLIVAISCMLGFNNIWNALSNILPIGAVALPIKLMINGLLSLGIVGWLSMRILK